MQESRLTFLCFNHGECYMFLQHQDSGLSTLSQNVIVIIISCGEVSGLSQLA